MSIIGRFVLSIFLSLMFVVASHAQTRADDSLLATASAIQFAPEFRAEVRNMLRRSPTFRAQYRRIVDAGTVVVGVHSDPRLCQTGFRSAPHCGGIDPV